VFKLLHLEMWMKATDVRSKAETLLVLFRDCYDNSSAAPDNAEMQTSLTHSKEVNCPNVTTCSFLRLRAQPLCYCQGTSCTCSLTTHTLQNAGGCLDAAGFACDCLEGKSTPYTPSCLCRHPSPSGAVLPPLQGPPPTTHSACSWGNHATSAAVKHSMSARTQSRQPRSQANCKQYQPAAYRTPTQRHTSSVCRSCRVWALTNWMQKSSFSELSAGVPGHEHTGAMKRFVGAAAGVGHSQHVSVIPLTTRHSPMPDAARIFWHSAQSVAS
jgi:hypothetical protein